MKQMTLNDLKDFLRRLRDTLSNPECKQEVAEMLENLENDFCMVDPCKISQILKMHAKVHLEPQMFLDLILNSDPSVLKAIASRAMEINELLKEWEGL